MSAQPLHTDPTDADLVLAGEQRLRRLLDRFNGSRRALRRELLGELAGFLDVDAWAACDAYDRLAGRPDAELMSALRAAHQTPRPTHLRPAGDLR
ncbi:MAG: hypothetical protein ACR2JO_13805 [Mycobacteriales bacterium]